MNQAAGTSARATRARVARTALTLRLTVAFAVVTVLPFALLPLAACAEEVQVPLDRSGHVQRIDAQLAKRLGTLTDRYPGFTEARLFRAPDSTFTFEVTMARGGKVLRERVPFSAASVDSLREQISLLVAQKAPHAGLNQEGRTLLLAGTTLLGLGFYGWALPVATYVEDGQAIAGAYLLVAGGSFFLPFAATGGQSVTYGMTDLALYGATRGIPHGILIYQLFTGNKGEPEALVGSAMVASIAEGVGGYVWAQRAQSSAGSAQTISTLGDFGLLEGLGVASLADYYDQGMHSAAAATALAGSAAGIAGGAALARHRDYSYGDASVMRNAGILGAFAGTMVADWFQPQDKAYVTAAMIGGAAGLMGGDRMVSNTDFNVGQSVLNTLGMVAGGLLGLGVGYVSTSDKSDNGTVLLTSSMLGSALGFAATYGSFLPAARVGRTDHSSLQIELSPLAALAAGALRPGGSRPDAIANAHLVRVSCRF